MTTAARPESGHRRPHTPPLANPFLEFDLTTEVNHLHGETTWTTGQNARTLVKYEDLRVVLMALQAEARMPEHKTDGRISIHLLSGHVRLTACGRTFDLRPGSLVALDQGVPHGVEALEQSAVLLTITKPRMDAPMK